MHLEYISQMWDALYDKEQETRDVLGRYFHPAYTQCINHVEMNLEQYITHVDEQKKSLKEIRFKYGAHLSQAEKLFAIYYPKGKTVDGKKIEAEVIAYFEFKDNKVFRIHGQVHLLQGDAIDVDM